MLEYPSIATLRTWQFGADRKDRSRGPGPGHTEHSQDLLDGIVDVERRAVEWDHVLQRCRGRAEQGFPVQAGDDRVVDLEKNALALLRGTERGSPGLHEALQVLGQDSELAHDALTLDLGNRGGRKNAEDSDLLLRPFVRLFVHDAERSEGKSLGSNQRDPRVSDHSDVGTLGALREKRIETGVRHDERLARSDRMLAEGVRQRGLPLGRQGLGQPGLTLEELPITVHQRDERHGHVKHGRRQARQPVERLIRRGVEERRPTQGFEASLVLDDVGQLVPEAGARRPYAHVRTAVLHASGKFPTNKGDGECGESAAMPCLAS